MTTRSRTARRAVLAALLLAGGVAGAARAQTPVPPQRAAAPAPEAAAPSRPRIDPFYASRLREGIAAADRKAWPEAAASLRVACFGMLDSPPDLADCLVRLALAQAGAGDREGFAATFDRVLEAEGLVGLYTRAALAPGLQTAFEARVAEWIPRAALSAAPAFAHLIAGQDESRLAGLAPRARRSRLQELAREEPGDPRWPLMLARLERGERQPQAALAAAEAVLGLVAQHAEARCLRGWARAELEQWPAAAADLAGCSASWPDLAAAELAARVELEQWAEARALAGTLSEAQRRDGQIARLLRRLERDGARADAATPPAPAGAATPVPAPAPSAVAAAPALTEADERALAAVRDQLARASSPAEVERAYASAAQLAGRYPGERRVQHAAAEGAYRAARWSDAVRYFRQGGDPGEDQPLLLFYLAVALWESGDREGAVAAMQRCEGRLRPTPFVEDYRRKILARAAG